MRRLPTRIALALAAALLAAPVLAQDRPEGPEDINKSFRDPDVAEFIKRFESESREVYAERQGIVTALHLRPTMDVADIGAGTGLFTRLFAEKVGPDGVVFAVDIAPAFLAHIEARARAEKQPQIRTVRGTQDSTNLPPDSIDLAFLSDTYHHLEHPEKALASIHKALRPGGRLVVIDFDRNEESSDFVKSHVRAPKEVFFHEIEAAGFKRQKVDEPPGLKENFFAVFAKPESPEDESGQKP